MIHPVSFNFVTYKPSFKNNNQGKNIDEEKDGAPVKNVLQHTPEDLTRSINPIIFSDYSTFERKLNDAAKQNVQDLMMEIRKKSLKGMPVDDETTQLEKYMNILNDLQNCPAAYCTIRNGCARTVSIMAISI